MATTLSPELLRSRGEALLQDVSREYYMAHSGLRPSAQLQPIYERYADINSAESLALVRGMFDAAPEGSTERSSARTLLDWQLESLAARELAALDEKIIALEGSAAATLPDGRVIQYQRLMVELSQTPDRDERMQLDAARCALVAGTLAPLRHDRVLREMDLLASQNIAPGFVSAASLTSGIDLVRLGEECRVFLADTADMWNEMLARAVRMRLGLDPRDLTRADAHFLFRATHWDAAFPAESLVPSINRQAAEMGLDYLRQGRIVLDVEPREGKRSRAFCAPVRVPHEVYLVLLPHGGRSDYRTFLHELGHALHFANADTRLPFEHRWLGDNSVTEGYAMLFDHLIQDDSWLARYTGMPRAQLAEHRFHSALEELHYVRRYCAKLLFELEAYEGLARNVDTAANRFVEIMTASTGFRYSACDAFVDFDPRFYSARYLRAWQLQAVLTLELRERFDVDWYRNPHAGPWVASELMGAGQRELAQDLALRATGKSLNFAALQRRIEELAA